MGDLAALLADAAHGRPRSARTCRPSRATSRSAPSWWSTVSSGMSAAIPATLRARIRTMRSWLSGSYGDVAGAVLLLQPADPVLEAGRPRESPTGGRASRRRARTGGSGRRRSARSANAVEMSGRSAASGIEPRLRAVGEVRVGEQEHRRAVLERDARRLDRDVEAAAGSRRGEHRHRRLGVAAEQHHQQVGLLRLRRHPRRRAGALDVEDHERQLERDREPDRLRLEDDARAARGRDAERAAEGRAERGADRGDLVLGLEGADAEVLVAARAPRGSPRPA